MTNGTITEETKLDKVKRILMQEDMKIIGIHYTNAYFTKNPITRSFYMKELTHIDSNKINLGFFLRLPYNDFPALEMTLNFFEITGRGDVMGYIAEGDITDKPHLEEKITNHMSLFTADMFVSLENPNVVIKPHTINKYKVYEVKIKDTHSVDGLNIDQEVTLVIGDSSFNSVLGLLTTGEPTIKDVREILDLLSNKNVTGKAFTGVLMNSPTGIVTMEPRTEMMSIRKRIGMGGYHIESEDTTFTISELFLENVNNIKVGIDDITNEKYIEMNNDELYTEITLYFEV
ncbi:gp131 [Bacillus phage W.Ph.]|uniref:Gp131 n=1 Tax=Bacillus phage W.Ph. TaxID=764595 RepID=G9B1N2_9CAUD|nr:gp131 [Bacillus phage W.Ph.]ADH03277.1 gp131 [Bacillus phage W.Ph.]